jgi:hypothetical protein
MLYFLYYILCCLLCSNALILDETIYYMIYCVLCSKSEALTPDELTASATAAPRVETLGGGWGGVTLWGGGEGAGRGGREKLA